MKDKGYTGEFSKKENKAIAEICKKDSFVNLFSDLTYGNGFRKRLSDAASSIVQDANNIFNLYLDLVIFDKADLAYYPSELFIQQYHIDLSVFVKNDYKNLSSEQKNIVDYLRVDVNGLTLKNRLFVDMIWKKYLKTNYRRTICFVGKYIILCF